MTTKAPAQSRLYGSAAGALLLLLSVAYFGILAPYGLELADEGHLVHQIYRTYLGQLPYVDFHTGYTPAVYYWNAAVFSLFGVNLVLVRLCLAAVNALSVWCLFWLARRLGASVPAAVVTGLLYLAFIPFFDGHFASFNIPYPAWYGTLFWLLSLMCVLCWWERRGAIWWLVAGLCAGMAFAFKQNGGLLNLAALAMTACLMERPVSGDQGPMSRLGAGLRRAERTVRWLLPLGGTLALMAMFDRAAGVREVEVFALPLLVVALWQLLVPRARLARPVHALTLWRDLLLLALGFLLVTVPWVAYFWQRLGTAGLLESILYIGGSSNYQKFYFVLYPQVGFSCVLFLAVGGVLVSTGLLMRRGWLPRRLVMAALAMALLGATLWLIRRPMVEGFQRSVVLFVQDLSFALVLATAWAAIAVHIGQTARRRPSDPPDIADVLVMPADSLERDRLVQSSGTFLIVLVSGILMHAQLFPRSDFQHLVFSAPAVVVLGGQMFGALATLWGRGMARRARDRRVVRVAALLPVYAVVAIALAPAVSRIEYMVRAAWEQDGTALVRLESPYAPLVMEPAAARSFMALSSAVHYVQAHTRPDDFVFTFPCLDAFAFLLDRRDPTRHGYYYPGSPGRAVEAEVIDTLRDRQPPYIVALHDHALYFSDSPLYYFNLRHYVSRHYHPVQRLDMFDVLRRNDDAAEPPPVEEASAVGERTGDETPGTAGMPVGDFAGTVALWRRELEHRRGATARQVDAALAAMPSADVESLAGVALTLDSSGQRLLVDLVRKSRSAAGAAALATALEAHALSAPVRDLFLQAIMERGDQRSVVPLLETLKNAEFAELGGISTSLFYVESRAAVESYWYVPRKRLDGAAIDDVLPVAQAITWIDNPWELLGLRFFAIGMAGSHDDQRFTPFLVRVLGDANENPALRVNAAQGLVGDGRGDELFPMIVSLLTALSPFPPVLAAEVYRQAPERSRSNLVQSMHATNDNERATAFWIAAGAQDGELIDELRAGLSDPLMEVRIAAVWGLGNLGGDDVLPELGQVSRDGNKDLAVFAERAIQRIVGSKG